MAKLQFPLGPAGAPPASWGHFLWEKRPSKTTGVKGRTDLLGSPGLPAVWHLMVLISKGRKWHYLTVLEDIAFEPVLEARGLDMGSQLPTGSSDSPACKQPPLGQQGSIQYSQGAQQFRTSRLPWRLAWTQGH